MNRAGVVVPRLGPEEDLLGGLLPADVDRDLSELLVAPEHRVREALVATARNVSGSTPLTRSPAREAARQPTDIPRKQAMSAKFVKKVRKTTVLPNQRMQVSSKKRMTKLIANSSISATPTSEGSDPGGRWTGPVGRSCGLREKIIA